MFKARREKIKLLGQLFPQRVFELEELLVLPTRIYIDFANVRPWAQKLGWHVEPMRLKQFFDSFDTVAAVKIYNGRLEGDLASEKYHKELIKHYGSDYITKPVKIMRKSIDVSSIPSTSTDILSSFIRPSLLRQLKIETIEYLNTQLGELNKQGIRFIEDRKCNFDVEMGSDMLLDLKSNNCDCFIVWSGDSDFANPVEQILRTGKRVCIFATARKISAELNNLISDRLGIYDIQKIKNFICWAREMDG